MNLRSKSSLGLGLLVNACLFSTHPNTNAEGWRNSPQHIQDDARLLFEGDNLELLTLELDPTSWQTLQKTAKSEIYVPGTFKMRGQTLDSVGIRYKGSYGSLISCFNGTQVDSSRCPKLSLKLDFSEYRPNQRFMGLHKLNLHALNNDPSKLHDLLAYSAYAKAGIHAPRAFPVRVQMYGEDLGVYLMVENIDGRFSSSRYREGNGKVFKETWPTAQLSTQKARMGLESNAGDSNVIPIQQFGKALALGQDLSTWTDVQEWMRYLAIDEWINNWDGVSTWYCGATQASSCANHNYYWYQESTRDFFHIIPWDMDGTFNTTNPWPDRPAWDDLNASCKPAFYGTNRQIPAACDPLFQQLLSPQYAALRQSEREWVFNHIALSPDLQAQIQTWTRIMAPWIAQDPRNPSRSNWNNSLLNLQNHLQTLTKVAQLKTKGLSPQPLKLRVPGPNQFENTSDLELQMGARIWASAGSQLQFSNPSDLSGGHRLRLDFQLRDADSSKPWSFWNNALLGFQEIQDLKPYAYIHFWARSNACRNVRFEYVFDGSTASQAGAHWGWDFEICPEWQEFMLETQSGYTWSSWYKGPQDSLALALSKANALRISPSPLQNGGFIGPAQVDSGFIELDDLEWKLYP